MTDDEAGPLLAERLFGAALGAFDLLCVYIGDRLGLYRALAEHGPSTAGELGDIVGVHPRYAREWLEQQALTGILAVDDQDAGDDERRYSLPAGHAPVLIEEAGLQFMTPMAQLFVACARPVDAVVDAFRTGDGVPYADYGHDLHEGQARFSRVLFDNLLTSEWLPSMPEVHRTLQREDPPARVADVACGQGRSTLAIARGYPHAHVDGIDADARSPCSSTGRTRPRSGRPAPTSPRPTRTWPAASRSPTVMPPTPRPPAPTTSSRSSRPSTTCRTPSRCSAPPGNCWPPAGWW